MIKFYLRYLYYEILSLIYFFIIRKKNIHSYQVFFRNHSNLFNDLCIKYGTDKGFKNFHLKKFYGKNIANYEYCYPHIYSKFYNDQFFPIRKEIKLIFECGIGDKTEKKIFKPGASLKVWRDFFPNANIYGGDINKNILFKSSKIRTYHVNQVDKLSILKMWKKIKRNNFDIIVDDGLHNYKANITFFKFSFKYLKKGGAYIIEDILLQNIFMYEKYFKYKKLNFEIIHFNNENYSNHCLIKIIK